VNEMGSDVILIGKPRDNPLFSFTARMKNGIGRVMPNGRMCDAAIMPLDVTC